MKKAEIKEMLIKQCCESNVNDNRLNKAVSTYGSIDIDELSKVIEDFKKVPTLDELIKENNKLQSKIDQQDQIIREAREYVKEHTYDDSVDGDGTSLMFEKANGYDLLEILDRNVK